MKKILVCALLVSAVPARAGEGKVDGACKADVEKVCPGTRPGDGKYGPCMTQHREELSPACKASVEGMMKDSQKRMDKLASACGVDSFKFCAGLKPGDGQWGPCMKGHIAELSPECKGYFARGACGEEEDKFCSGMKSRDEKWTACLQGRKDKLSPRCAQFLKEIEEGKQPPPKRSGSGKK